MRRILLVVDHAIVAKAIEIIFETGLPDYELEIARNTNTIIKALQERSYRLIMINIQPEGGNIEDLLIRIRSLYPNIAILLFSNHPEKLFARTLYKYGISGYLHKDADDKEVILALKTALEGNTYISESYKPYLLFGNQGPYIENPGS